MAAHRDVSVILSDSLWKALRRQADVQGVSIKLLAAGLVCDTIEALAARRLRQRDRQTLKQKMQTA